MLPTYIALTGNTQNCASEIKIKIKTAAYTVCVSAVQYVVQSESAQLFHITSILCFSFLFIAIITRARSFVRLLVCLILLPIAIFSKSFMLPLLFGLFFFDDVCSLRFRICGLNNVANKAIGRKKKRDAEQKKSKDYSFHFRNEHE